MLNIIKSVNSGFLRYFCGMRFSAIALLLLMCFSASAQKEWTLQRSVDYAINHNISIQQNVLNKRLADLTLQQSQLSQLPSVNANGAFGRSYGRSVDPTTNQFVEGNSYDFLSLSGNANVLVFGWFQTRNTIASNKLKLAATKTDLDQLKNDVSLNVATGYLRALLAREQVRVSRKQVELSMAQLDQTRKFVDAGRLPELNAAQLEAQLAGDSSKLITAITDYNAAILDIKAILNLDFDVPYDLSIPNINMEQEVGLMDMNPEEIYLSAARNLGTIKSNQLRLEAAQKDYLATKGTLYPQLSIGAQFGTNWASTFVEPYNFRLTGAQPTGDFIPVTGVDTFVVYQPTYEFDTRTIAVGQQLKNNFRQTVTLNLNVPLFNGWQTQTAVKQAKINVLTQELNKKQAELTLKQDVYKAFNDAKNSIQKYYAADRSAKAAQRAYDFAEQRYELGLTNTVEYLTTQNTLYNAESQLASAKYDLIFKLKVIDYYLGRQLKL